MPECTCLSVDAVPVGTCALSRYNVYSLYQTGIVVEL